MIYAQSRISGGIQWVKSPTVDTTSPPSNLYISPCFPRGCICSWAQLLLIMPGVVGSVMHHCQTHSHTHSSLPDAIVVLNDAKGTPVYSAGQELQKRIPGYLRQAARPHRRNSRCLVVVVIGDAAQLALWGLDTAILAADELGGDGFSLDVKGCTA